MDGTKSSPYKRYEKFKSGTKHPRYEKSTNGTKCPWFEKSVILRTGLTKYRVERVGRKKEL